MKIVGGKLKTVTRLENIICLCSKDDIEPHHYIMSQHYWHVIYMYVPKSLLWGRQIKRFRTHRLILH